MTISTLVEVPPAKRVALVSLVLSLFAAPPVLAAIPRTVPIVAEIVWAHGDERLRFVDDPTWRPAEVRQHLAGGDTLQTGGHGALAILFRDQTQIRVQRNSDLVIKSVQGQAGAAETRLRLERGRAWSRARPTPDVLKMETPAVTAAIRGTDWHLRVEDDGRTTLIVLDGVVELRNALGAVTVARGEIGVTEVGKAPLKTILLNPKDRPQWELIFTPDWVRLLPVSGLSATDLRRARPRLESAAASAPTAETLLDLAEVEYEWGDPAEARRALTRAQALFSPVDSGLGARAALIEGLLDVQALRLDEADRHFVRARRELTGHRQLIADLGRHGVRVLRRAYDEAEAILDAAAVDHDAEPALHLDRIVTFVLRGEMEQALEMAERQQRRFTSDSRFDVWLAFLRLLADEPEKMKAAIDDALAKEPEQHLAWYFKGVFHHFVSPDPRLAREAYLHALDLFPNYAPSWNNLGLLTAERGDWEAARRSIERAQQLAPGDALYKATYALLLIGLLERLDEGAVAVAEALALDPAQATALAALGLLQLKRGRADEAVASMLRATVVDPGLAGASTALGIAAYQAGDFRGAEQALGNARRLDPNDAVAPLVASVYAQDQARAGEAIRLAREALARHERFPGLATEGLSAGRSGALNLGSAYAGLGLTDWGEYLGQLSAEPAAADSHFFLATLYPSPFARRSDALQGLVLDSLAVSGRTRYVDLIRRPFHDLTVGSSVGVEGGGLTNSQFGSIQGLVRGSPALAYFVDIARSHNDGYRRNGATTIESGNVALGARLTAYDDVLFTFSAAHAKIGVPGTRELEDPDDTFTSRFYDGAVAYHHRFGAGNHLLARIGGGYVLQRLTNDAPFGQGLGRLTLSLIQALGLNRTQNLYNRGICAGFLGATLNVFPGGLCPGLGLSLLTSDIPERLDLKPTSLAETERRFAIVQFRQLIEVGALRLTGGLEWQPDSTRVVTRFLRFRGDDTGNLFPGTPFTLGSAIEESDRHTLRRHAAVAYAAGDWRPVSALRIEAGLFGRYWNDDHEGHDTKLDPRLGIAWRVGQSHWLRVAVQRNRALPLEDTLAPLTTVGLLAREELTAVGGSTTAVTGRWDAEWSSRVFTYAGVDVERIHNFIIGVPQTLEVLTTPIGQRRSVTLGTNLWALENVGFYARYRRTWTEVLSRGPDRGHDLPLVPVQSSDVGVVWVHPAQVRATVALTYVGNRWADLANRDQLHDEWTVNAGVTWQPWRKHWLFTLAGQNLLDRPTTLARRVPGPGIAVSFGAEYRF